MRAKKLTELLTHSFAHRRKVLVVGPPGCGKSDIIAQACAAAQFELLISHPAISDPTDYKGMPAVVGDGTKAEFLPFGDLNKLIEATKDTVCFLDDLGQAAPAVQAALMQLILARRVNGHTISDKVVFCAATNDTTHFAGVSGLLEPVKSRWHTIVSLDVDTNDWCEWAIQQDLPAEVIAFIRFRPALLNDFKPTRELRNSPCPRTVASVGEWLKCGVKDYDVIAGAAGEGFATEFTGFLKMYAELPSLDAILLDPLGTPTPHNPAACYAVITGLARKATPKNFESVLRYVGRMEKEFEVCCMRDAVARDANLARTPTAIQWFTKNAAVMA